jgi:tetratricopeptide (TPR) repeat protein
MVHDRRYLLVFDNFESVLPSPGGEGANLVQPNSSPAGGPPDGGRWAGGDALSLSKGGGLLSFFTGLLAARWRGLLLFTSRQPWPALDEYVGRGTALGLELPDLTARQAIMLMDNLPRLRQEKLESKIAVYHKVGGHPKSLELLEGWLASGRLTDLLDNAALDGLLRPQWEDYFLKALLAQLPQAERETLERLSIFETALDEEEFTYAGVNADALQHWQALSLVQRQQAAAPDVAAYLLPLLPSLPEAERRKLQPPAAYTLHPLVRDYLLGGLPADERARLHAWAAEFYGRPFIEMARQYVQRTGQTATEEQIAQFSRDRNGVVGQMVHRTDDLPAARSFMARALQWQAQLFKAGQYEAASDIITAVHDVLARWGERDHAKALLQGSIRTLEGPNKAVAQSNLATLLAEEGQLAEALATYEQVYATFATLDAKQNMGTVLELQSTVLKNMGRLDEAIARQEASLEIKQSISYKEGQAISLHQLSILHDMQKDYPRALERSQAAEALNRKLKREVGVALNLHEQGNIFNEMARAAGDESAAREYIRTAAERFTQSLEINRRIGNQSAAADTLCELGKLWMEAGQMPQAIAAFNEALETYQRQGKPAKVGLTLEFLGSVHERQEQYPAALEKFRQALRLAQQYGSPQQVANNDRHIARVQAKL